MARRSRSRTAKRRTPRAPGWSNGSPPTESSARSRATPVPEARRRWILDPIDGTKTFVRRVPLWGTLVALAEGESVLAGAAFFPAVGELVVAARGEGCRWNGRPARVSTVGPAGCRGRPLHRGAPGWEAPSSSAGRRAGRARRPGPHLGRLLRLPPGGHRPRRGDGRRGDGPVGCGRAPADHRGGRGCVHRLERPADRLRRAAPWRPTAALAAEVRAVLATAR